MNGLLWALAHLSLLVLMCIWNVGMYLKFGLLPIPALTCAAEFRRTTISSVTDGAKKNKYL
ncbi:hypothetical protein MUBE_10225 [Mycobacterium uberis]|uniref:Uncharacterized protein n=1 Tax=Mycobacterium uberis TaxID=2162698 RepID=A0A3E1HG92_9MYCO|nr:hypothetical protein MUBE_10225 [Mycobacterium uberis]